MSGRLFVHILRSFLSGGTPRWLNLAALSLGYAATLLALLLYHHESSYDSWQRAAERTYRVEISTHNFNGTSEISRGAGSQPALGPAMLTNMGSVEAFTRYFGPRPVPVRGPDGTALRSIVNIVDENFLEFFSFRLLRGDPQQALSHPNDIVLTEVEALRLFGRRDIVGEQVIIRDGLAFTVSGVLAPLPERTHFRFFGMLAPTTNPISGVFGDGSSEWNTSRAITYFRTIASAPTPDLEADISEILSRYYPGGNKPSEANYKIPTVLKLSDIHLNTTSDGIIMKPNGKKEIIDAFLLIAFGLLLIITVNSLNIENIISIQNMHNTAIRKIFGASTYNIFIDRFILILLLSFIAFFFGIILSILFLPFFESMVDIEFDLSAAFEGKFLLYFACVLFLATSVLVTYPSLLAVWSRPARLMTPMRSSQHGAVRGLFVALQFVVAIFFLVSAILVSRQLVHLSEFDRGFDTAGKYIVSVDSGTEDRLDILAQQAETLPAVEAVARIGGDLPRKLAQKAPIRRTGKSGADTADLNVDRMFVDPAFARVFEIEPLAGRWFQTDRSGDPIDYRRVGRSGAVVLTENAVSALGFDSPQAAMGAELVLDGMFTTYLHVIGVLPDIHWGEARDTRSKAAYLYAPDDTAALAVSADDIAVEELRASLKQLWNRISPGSFLALEPLEAKFGALQADDRRRGRAFVLIAGVTIMISCIGLYGLVSFYVEKHGREIAVRKLAGARARQLMGLLIARYLRPVAVALVAGLPLAYGYNAQWLAGFAERISMGIAPFLVAVIAILAITVATFWTLIARAVRQSPIVFLRDGM